MLENGDANPATPVMGYIAIELDLPPYVYSSIRNFLCWLSISDRAFCGVFCFTPDA